MVKSKVFAFAVLCTAISASQATAGNTVEPIVEPEVIVAETRSTGDFVLPLLLLAILLGVASGGGGGGTGTP